jgi:hypothetical protein
MALLTDTQEGNVLDGIAPHIGSFPAAFKAATNRKGGDPDTPTFYEAMSGPHEAEFRAAMERELRQLIELDCWDVLWRTQLPKEANILPSTWAFKVKRKPSGEFLKFKARFCARGDKQIEGVDYTDKYAPVVSWRSVRMMPCLAASQGLHTKQVDFSNAFVQADIHEDVFISLPPGFGPPGTRSHYMDWYKHLCTGLTI